MKNKNKYDYLLKLLLVGDSSVGIDFKVKYLKIDNKTIKVGIWDTAGQERFRTLTSAYYRNAHAIILVYDCTVRESFENLDVWIHEIDKYSTNKNAIKMLVANKIDKANHEVTKDEGKNFAFENNMLFCETSAKNDINITYCFEELIQQILNNPSLLELSIVTKNLKLSKKEESRANCVC
ncbi:small GTPase Rab18 [Plasmodium vivax North Korean]|uniref:Small GTPase Rab18 n=1 Tax=Plasmodium vivax North Korean TaxID=1035514 RepID=A0A0J9WFI9_PLAVI|nr:small GTPase Rab18 [Plasmodium vivax North Korean]